MAKFSKTIGGYKPNPGAAGSGDTTAYDSTLTSAEFPGQKSIFSGSTPNSITADAESVEYLEVLNTKEDRFIPHINFATASNFAKFGSAKKYYGDAFVRIHNFYPYDGSKKEAVQWELSSSYLDRYIFKNEYPRTTGYITVGSSRRAAGIIAAPPFNFFSSSNPEYVYFKGGPNPDPFGNFKIEKEPGKSTTAISKANYYDVSEKRVSNLKFDPNSGITVEFWLKKSGFLGSAAANVTETIFHLLNTGSNIGTHRGDFRIYVDSLTANRPYVFLGIASGSTALTHSVSTGLSTIADNKWHHYAISNGNSGSFNYMKLYVDGKCVGDVTGSGAIGEVTGSLVAALGANAGPVADNVTMTGSAGWANSFGTSFDEFRYWKTERNAKQIGRFYIDQVAGGTNTDTANTDLGVYYKFNEGITGTASVDSTILDYSGRISNGNFIGYASGFRNVGSAIVSASAAPFEFKDPIIYNFHPDVVAKLAALQEKAEFYDSVNANALINNVPAWIIENDVNEGSENLANMIQIIASYLDTLYLQTEALPTLKDVRYAKDNEKPFFFNQKLLSDFGFETEEILTDNSLFAYANNRDEKILFAKKLYDVKNQIYKNIYNNLTYLNKTKGSAKSFRNLLRCLGIDEEILRLSIYSDGYQQDIRTNYRVISSKQKYVDFFNNNNASVYINYDSSNPYSVGFVSGGFNSWDPPNLSEGFNWLESAAATIETEVVFPKYAPKIGIDNNFTKEFPNYTSSIFGAYVPEDLDQQSTDATIRTEGSGSFQVYVIRNNITETNPDAYFLLTGSFGSLTSSYFEDVYQNSKWSFAVKVKPEKSPFFPFMSGTTDIPLSLNVEFQGINTIENQVINEFTVTSSWTDPVNSNNLAFLADPKRLYIGANRQNFTDATVNYPSDVYISSLRYWLKDLTRQELLAHAIDDQNYGTIHPYQNSFLFEKGGDGGGEPVYAKTAESVQVPQMATLALNWNFDTITGSNASGEFTVPDFSYGTGGSSYSQLSGVLSQQYVGKAINFAASSTDVVERKNIYAYRQELPDIIYSDDQVDIVDFEGEIFTRESRPIEYFYAFEKSMYRSISEDMLNLFATLQDFHRLIGEPVNRYRTRYKNMEKIRQLFFQRVSNTPDLDKFLEFYKWIDNSISNMLNNLVPASAPFAEKTRDVIESHVLERNKYQSKFPTIENKLIINASVPATWTKKVAVHRAKTAQSTAMRNFDQGTAVAQQPAKIVDLANFLSNDGIFISSPTSILGSANQIANPQEGQKYNPLYWQFQAEATNPVISVDNGGVIDNHREALRAAFRNQHSASIWDKFVEGGDVLQTPTMGRAYSAFSAGRIETIGRLSNYDIGFVGSALKRGAPGSNGTQALTVVVDSGSARVDYFAIDPRSNKDPNLFDGPTRRFGIGVTYDSNTSPYRVGEGLLPFGIYSSSAQSGYKTALNSYFPGAELNRKFLDLYRRETQQPLQGPFASTHVGGNPYRHNTPLYNNNILGDVSQRSELYNMSVGTGTLTLSRRDLTQVGSNYYRDEISKRPFVFKNIKSQTSSFVGGVQQTFGVLGNYNKDYEIVQATTAIAQKGWLRDNYEGGVNFTQTTAEVLFLTGNLDYNIQVRTGSALAQSTFVGRFSAPGSAQVLSDGYLDPFSLSLSVYNNLNYRNALVRLITNGTQFTSTQSYVHNEFRTLQTTQPLNALMRDHTSWGGYDALTGAPSFHKIQRNTRRRMVYSGSTIVTQSFYDNGFVQHQIPQSDRQYAWITASLEENSPLLGFILNTSSATFITKSQASVDGMYQDFVGMNNTYYIPIDFSTNTVKIAQSAPSGLISSQVAAGINLRFLKAGFVYGYPTWRQLACHAGWSTQAVLGWQKRHSVLSVITRESYKNLEALAIGPASNLRKGELQIANIVDPVAIDANKSLLFTLTDLSPNGAQKITLSVPYCNNVQTFANNDVNYIANFNDDNLSNLTSYDLATADYRTVIDLYLTAPGVSFNSVKYSRKIYPRTQNTFLSGTKGRINYAELKSSDVDNMSTNGLGRSDIRTFWKDSLTDRLRTYLTYATNDASQVPVTDIFNNICLNNAIHSLYVWKNDGISVWPLDGPQIAKTDGSSRVWNTGSRGVLHKGPIHSKCFIYSTGVVSTGVFNCYKAFPRFHGTDDFVAIASTYGSNEVNWTAAADRGINPWYNSYESYSEDLRYVAKNSTIIPEFNISNLLSYYLIDKKEDFNAPLPKNFLNLDGASITSSQIQDVFNTKFFKEYSTSDFLKDFDVILNDHKSFTDISSITLKCEGYKKLLPYNGFYPVTRTVQIASLLSQSYGTHLTGVSTAPTNYPIKGGNSDFVTHSAEAALQSFLQPLFAPGILYNTIKSGIAVDWPMFTGSTPQSSFGSGIPGAYPRISLSNNYRLQFDAIHDFTKMPVNERMYGVSNSIINDYCVYDGGTENNLYRLAINNFLAESVNLFLKDGKLTSFISKPMKEVSFETGKTYRMKVELEQLSGSVMSQGSKTNFMSSLAPISSSHGRVFGPPFQFSAAGVELTGSGTLGTGGFGGFDQCDPAYAPYTPPYYYGKATAILEYTNTVDDTTAPTLDMVINAITASYSSSLDTNIPNFTSGSISFRSYIDNTSPAIANKMQISASVSLFGKRILEKSQYDKDGNLVGMEDAEDISQFEQMVISTKYECPVLEFKTYDNEYKPRGMWNNYGVIPKPSEGLVMKLSGPSDKEMATDGVEDLKNLMFGSSGVEDSSGGKKIGKLPMDYEKTISEAIVAIPFMDIKPSKKIMDYVIGSPLGSDSKRYFFKIFETGEESGKSVKDLKDKMHKYVFPPKMDFVNNATAQPYVMFVFEFEQKLTRENLQDIWQGLMPSCAREVTKQNSSLNIPTKTNELLSEFLKHCAGNISSNNIITNTFNNLKWMVFKVKKRARNNYTAITEDLSDDQRLLSKQGELGKDLPYSYNWPYDYCSLVELANLTVGNDLSKIGAPPSTLPIPPTSKPGGNY